jgi:hypothetical protein
MLGLSHPEEKKQGTEKEKKRSMIFFGHWRPLSIFEFFARLF